MALCYKDRQWCAASGHCAQAECERKITPEVQAAAGRWWESMGGSADTGPVFDMADMSGRCGIYQPIEEAADGAA